MISFLFSNQTPSLEGWRKGSSHMFRGAHLESSLWVHLPLKMDAQGIHVFVVNPGS